MHATQQRPQPVDENSSWLNLRGVALATAPAEKAKLDRADGAQMAEASKAARQQQRRDGDAAAAQLHEATAVAAARDAGTLVFAAELVERNGAVRQLKLTYHLHAEHGAPAGGVSIEELPTNCANTGRVVGSARSLAARHNESAPVPFLARTRVLRDGTTHPANHDLQEQPNFHQVTPCTDRSKGEPHLKLRERLHWPAPAEEQFLQPEDLVPGAHLTLLGHRLRLLAPEPRTRAWLDARGLLPPGGHVDVTTPAVVPADAAAVGAPPSPPPLVPREDPHLAALKAEEARRAAAANFLVSPTTDDLARWRHGKASGWPELRDQPRTSGRGVRPRASETRRFERQLMVPEVLHFHLVWDEPPPADATGAAAAPLRRTFVLHFFVADGCVRIDEELGHNSGREFERGGVATFLRKGRLPKDDDTRRAEASTYRPNRWLGRSGDLDDGDVRYVGLDDLAVGATVGVHGRSMRVVGCDEPTRAYLRARGGARAVDDDELPGAGVGRCGAGAASAPYALPTTAPTTAAARHPLPAAEPGHDTRRRGAAALPDGGELEGWRVFPGDDRPGTGRAAALPSDTLRFRAVLVDDADGGPLPDRRFTLGYDVGAGVASVRELASRGHAAALVVKEAAVAGGEAALFLGARLPLHGRTYVVYEAEEAALSYMEARPDRFPASDAAAAVAAVRARVGERRARVEAAFAMAIGVRDAVAAAPPPAARKADAPPPNTALARARRHIATAPPRAAEPRARRSPPTLSQAEFVQALRDAGASAGLHADVTAFRAFAARPAGAARPPAGAAPGARANAELALDPALFLRALELASEVEDPRHSTSYAEHYSAAREAGGGPLSYASGAEFGAQ